jgi:hypothetical protein
MSNDFTLNTTSTIDNNAIIMLVLGVIVAATAVILIVKIAK